MMMIIKGKETDLESGQVTLTANEARILASELIRAAEESEDHRFFFDVDLFLLDGTKDKNHFKLRVFPDGSN